MKITEKIRSTSRDIMNYLTDKGKVSIRTIAQFTHLSKSAVHRHLHAQKKDKHTQNQSYGKLRKVKHGLGV